MVNKMGAKGLIFLIAVMVLISACSADKTKPVVTDITGAAVGAEESQVEGGEEINETLSEDVEAEINESQGEGEGTEINETEEELLPGTHIVTIKGLKLDPRELTIKKGETVIWEHEDEWEEEGSTRHYLAAHSNEFRTPVMYYGDTFEHMFNETGIFTYIDVMYKGRDAMSGEIVVE